MVLLSTAAGAAQVGPAGRSAQKTESDKSCLGCHEPAKLEEFRKKQGPEIIPEDPKERAAFAVVAAESDARKRRDAAERFVATYPQSWMLEPAYEAASKASIALGDWKAAVDSGRKSLRYLPENPFLLVPLSEAQTRLGDFAAAARSARDAAWYLDRFDRPSSMDETSWTKTKLDLQAQAWFEAGRAEASQNNDADAEVSLRKALALKPDAPGPALLLGLICQKRGCGEDAAAFFAAAAQSKTPLGQQAIDLLHPIYAASSVSRPFDEWVTAIRWHSPEQLPDERHPKGAYAGSESCRQCHSAQHSAWTQTGMGRMFRPYAADAVIGDFTSGQTVNDDSGKPVARAVIRDGKHFLEIRDGSQWKTYPVDYLIGSKWQQGYATRLPGGEIQVFPLQYNRIEKRWVNYWKIIDAPDSIRTDISRFHEVVPGATYQLECAPCHTSQERFEKGVYQAKAAYYREGGINCEMCHGPSQVHVDAMRAGRREQKQPGEAPVDFKKLEAAEYVAVCAQCHMQSGERDPEPGGAMNFSQAGAKFYRVLSSRPYVDYSRKAFYKDGRFRETVFIVESFVRTACFRKGGATCGTCHDPHPSDAATNLTSVKYASEPDRMCVGCHTQYREHPEAHTHHAAASEGSRCVSCHMPKIMRSLLFNARSHQIDDIPDAEMTARFGKVESPNACLTCHADKDEAWLTRAMSTWKR